MKQYLEKLKVDNKKEIYELIIDELWDKCEDGRYIDRLNEVEKPLIISQIIQDSINGGGINSFFYNNANSLTSEGLAAFQKIGLTKVYTIFQQAVELYPAKAIPDDLEECREILENLPDDNEVDDKWDALSNEFYDLNEYILNQNLIYVTENTEQF